MSDEPIRGQMASAFWGSDGKDLITAIPFMRYQCGECGVILNTSRGFPAKCEHCGKLNARPLR